MQRNIRIIAFLSIISTIFLACTKSIDLKTEVEFEVSVDHMAEGNVDEGLSTQVTVVPEAVLDEFSYSYSYSLSRGEGYFKDISGKKLLPNENVALSRFSTALTYFGSKAGAHTVKLVASDNYGFTQRVDIEYLLKKTAVIDTAETDTVVKSFQNEIIAFALPGQTANAIIDVTDHTISVNVPFGTDLNVAPTVLTLSALAEIAAAEEGQRDFSTPVTYSVKAENNAVQQWTVNVSVGARPNEVPTVDAGVDRVINLEGESDAAMLSLNGTADDDAGTFTLVWTLESGGAGAIADPSSANTVVNGMTIGTYIFRLTVTDSDGETATDTVSIRVNDSPTADAGTSYNLRPTRNSITVNGMASDSDGTYSVEWTKITGPAATIVSPNELTTEITGLVQGYYIFELTTTDNDNAVAKDRMFIDVKPIATFDNGTTVNITSPSINGTVVIDGGAMQFNISAFGGTGGTTVTFTINDISYSTTATPNQQNITVTPTIAAGTYTYSINGSFGGTGGNSGSVTASPAP